MTAKKKIRKHQGINQTTGRLKKGWKYGKNGAIVKASSSTSTSKAKPKKRKAKAKPRSTVAKVKAKVRSLGKKLGR